MQHDTGVRRRRAERQAQRSQTTNCRTPREVLCDVGLDFGFDPDFRFDFDLSVAWSGEDSAEAA
jgi:hypothetical protein